MKKGLVFLIDFYQKIISIVLKNILGARSFCRFSPSCSEFSKQSIIKHGVIKGGHLSLKRILSCKA